MCKYIVSGMSTLTAKPSLHCAYQMLDLFPFDLCGMLIFSVQVLQLLSSSGQENDSLSPVMPKLPTRLSNQAEQSSGEDLGSLGNYMMARQALNAWYEERLQSHQDM